MHFDWSTLFHVEWSLGFLLAALNIIFINLILSGDNAVLIAMAVRNLPKSQRMTGIIFGTGAAIVLRIILTFCVGLLFQISFLKLAGGCVILWLAAKLFVEAGGGDSDAAGAKTIGEAVRIILIADLTMSIDNVLAIAGAAQGNLLLLMFGLVMSIPIVVFTSNLLSALMDKYPVIIIIGAGILGKVGGEMIIRDPFIEKWLTPPHAMSLIFEAICVVGVIVAGKLWMKWMISRSRKEA